MVYENYHEESILARDEDIYDGIIDLEPVIEVREMNLETWRFETKAILRGQAALRYMEKNGIW